MRGMPCGPPRPPEHTYPALSILTCPPTQHAEVDADGSLTSLSVTLAPGYVISTFDTIISGARVRGAVRAWEKGVALGGGT
jgi:hypothetical protein